MINSILALIYIAFISLGLPDAVLGSAWPLMSDRLEVSIAHMGIVTIIISAGTIISSLQSDRLIRKIGIHGITTLSIGVTAIALLGFAFSTNFVVLCLWAIPYGLGAGSVDAALNNYAAIHFESKHMNWLHCMWGVGATLGPSIMGVALTKGFGFRGGYIILYLIQMVISCLIFFSKPLWKKESDKKQEENLISQRKLTLKEIFQLTGVKEVTLAFFCFSAVEQTTGLWASSYLVYQKGISPEIAASFASLFYLGITIGRAISGFISIKYKDWQMIRGGTVIMAMGIFVLIMPFQKELALVGLILIGLGSAPVFPCIIHSTPHHFGIANSQAITGVQMAAAYIGTLVMPAFFGIIGRGISFALYPFFIGLLLFMMLIMYEKLLKKVGH